MSLIEKAIDKLDKGATGSAQGAEPVGMGKSPQGNDASSGSPAMAESSLDAERSRAPESTDGHRNYVHVDLESLKAAGMLTPDSSRSRLAEEYRMIKRPLLMNAFGRGATIAEHANLIMVTSAMPAEGKTFSAVNLAMSIASEFDQTVLLVDADIPRPSVARLFGLQERKGLIDVLLREEGCGLGDVLLKTDVPKLTILPAGRTHPRSTELLASEAMRRLAQELSQRYRDRVVIFDSPPLLATSEASVLASLMGQIVMVIEATRTPRSAVEEALVLIKGPEIIGTVLNKSTGLFGGDYYASKYYSGYYG